MAKGKAETGALIIALAKKRGRERQPSQGADFEKCAKGIMAAIKSGSEADLATALRAFHDVDRNNPGGDDTY